jgi:acyl-CoA reductase-like NAD-dependent aldehyde dehydrogenase
MTRPMVCIFNVETQEEVIREMNDEEYAQHLAYVAPTE